MPNDCYNRVEIHGEPDQLKKVKELLNGKETCFDFNAVLPQPDYDKVRVYPTFPEGKSNKDPVDKEHAWWDWCIQNWGTKWNSYDCFLEQEEEDSIRYVFYTAWSPPEGIMKKLREKFPDVHISAFYDEPGFEIAGYY
tara:strand:+ start:178 stop:591 length:414 start_codon:yes stop_codon:yes gene_type:complete